MSTGGDPVEAIADAALRAADGAPPSTAGSAHTVRPQHVHDLCELSARGAGRDAGDGRCCSLRGGGAGVPCRANRFRASSGVEPMGLGDRSSGGPGCKVRSKLSNARVQQVLDVELSDRESSQLVKSSVATRRDTSELGDGQGQGVVLVVHDQLQVECSPANKSFGIWAMYRI